ncbi:MAG: FIST C-terminal domain-containing protein [Deltaproteobacteria bacterium]|jgi:hypothetical protein|nr:FIST C-terminal domain-containing protein [Deltaproteobacteria bacterium]
MIKTLLANTVEVDDIDIALQDILTQLNLGKNLRKNSLGIIHCRDDFIESGVVRAICDRLPFPVLGMNTILNSSSLGLLDNTLLTVSVLTSDSVNFAVGLSDPLTEGRATPLSKMYVEAENLLPRRPVFMFLYCGVYDYSALGEHVLKHLDDFSDGVPVFGSLPADYSVELRSPKIIYNGIAYSDRAAVVLVEGRITPVFSVRNVPLWRGIQRRAVVTSSSGNVIREVNGLPVIEFLESLGLCWYGQITGHNIIPIFVDRNDGNPPVVRVVHSQTRDDHILLTGDVPEGSTLGFGALDEREVISAVASLGVSMKKLYSDVFFVYSCISRNLALGLDYMAEMERFNTVAERKLPYVFSYSSGEFCPTLEADGSLVNRYHNMSLTSLAF